MDYNASQVAALGTFLKELGELSDRTNVSLGSSMVEVSDATGTRSGLIGDLVLEVDDHGAHHYGINLLR